MIPRFSRASWILIPSHPRPCRCIISAQLSDSFVEREEAFMSTGNTNTTENTSTSVPERARRLAWLGPPPLFKGEDAAAYEELSARVADAVKPEDIFEEIWAGDFINNEWDVLRYRREKASFMTSTAYEGLQKILEPLLRHYPDLVDLAEAWAQVIKRPSSGSMSSSRRLASPWMQSWPRPFAPTSMNARSLTE